MAFRLIAADLVVSGALAGTYTLTGSIAGNGYQINSAGQFYYAGTPGPGNLVCAIVPGDVGGVDQYGNPFPPGITQQEAGGVVQANLFAGQLTVQEATLPGTSVGPAGVVCGAVSVNGNLDTVSVGAMVMSEQKVALDVWHSMATRGYQNGWADSGSGPPGQFMLTCENTLRLIGDFTAGGTGDTTVLLNLPTAYHPKTIQAVPALLPGTSTYGPYRLSVQPSGNIECFGLSAFTSPRVVIPGGTEIPLDA